MDRTFRIGSLSITVRGPIDRCVHAQRRIVDCLGPDFSPPPPSTPSGFSFVDLPPEGAASQPASSSSGGAAPSLTESRSNVLASFPPLPDCWSSLVANCTAPQAQEPAGSHVRGWQAIRPAQPLQAECRALPALLCSESLLSITWSSGPQVLPSQRLYQVQGPTLTWSASRSIPHPYPTVFRGYPQNKKCQAVQGDSFAIRRPGLRSGRCKLGCLVVAG